MSGIFYVYEHWRPDTDSCFYVGKGKGSRSGRLEGRNKTHVAIVAKLRSVGLRVDVRIVERELTEAEAHSLEKSRIAFWRGEGIELANRTDGGEGFEGFIRPLGIRPSLQAKRKISLARRGMKFTSAHRANLAAKKQGIKRRPFTEETRARMRIAAAQREASKRDKFGHCVTRWSTIREVSTS